MRLDRTGKTFGQLTVLQDSATSDQLVCRCRCGREGLYPRTIGKPTYKGRLMCAWCAGTPCVICDELIPAKPGQRSATCSPACTAEHIKRRGRAWYNRAKNTQHWRDVRTAYLAHIKQRMATEPAFAEQRRAQQRKAVKRHRAKMTPEQRSARLAAGRAAALKALEKVRACGNYAAYLARHRQWYASLSDEDYQRLYRRPRGARRRGKDA
jgi:hypothetical protein